MFDVKGLMIDLFHKRQQKLRGEIPNVYQYEKFPEPLKVQMVHIWRENLGEDYKSDAWNLASENR